MLRGFAVRDNVARFTLTEHQADWAEVKKVFVALGAKWKTGKPVGGFVFPEALDGVEVVRVALENGEITDPRLAGFFATPTFLANDMVSRARIRPGDVVLEPSAGRGAILHAIRLAFPRLSQGPEGTLLCCELLEENRAALREAGFRLLRGSDFLAVHTHADVILMNPPFGDRADIHHILHAITLLRPGGRLVAIASAGVRYRQDALAVAFRKTLDAHGAAMEDLPDGTFAASGTMVRTVIISLTL